MCDAYYAQDPRKDSAVESIAVSTILLQRLRLDAWMASVLSFFYYVAFSRRLDVQS